MNKLTNETLAYVTYMKYGKNSHFSQMFKKLCPFNFYNEQNFAGNSRKIFKNLLPGNARSKNC